MAILHNAAGYGRRLRDRGIAYYDAVTAAATAAREHTIRSVYTNAPPAAPAPRKARKKQKGARKKARGLLWT